MGWKFNFLQENGDTLDIHIFLSYWRLFARMADKKFLIRIPIESGRHSDGKPAPNSN